jgi:hypothetical protein
VASGPTATLGGPTAQPFAAYLSRAPSTFVAPRAAPMPLAVPHVAPMTPPVPRTISASTAPPHASRGYGVPALLTSPSGCVRATGTASNSAVAVSKAHTDDTSDQPSSDDHAGEAGLPAAGRQTHIVDHLVVIALSDAHFRPRCPRQPVVVPCHGGRI